jgi:hypothetical protein
MSFIAIYCMPCKKGVKVKKNKKKRLEKVILRPVNKEEMPIIQCWECGQGIEINTTPGPTNIK